MLVDMPITGKLCAILDDYGHDLVQDHKRLRALLKDLCYTHMREVNILVLVVEHGIVTRLKGSATSCPMEILFAQCRAHIENTLGLDQKAAQWAVETWAAAIGVFPPRPIPRPKYNLMKRDEPKPPTPHPPTSPHSQPQAAMPLFDPLPGRYPGKIEIFMSCRTPGATIHYTEDGSEPTASSPKYDHPLSTTNPVSIKARAFCGTMLSSDVAEGFYRIFHSGAGKPRPGGGLAPLFQAETTREGAGGSAPPNDVTTTVSPLFLKDASVNSGPSENPFPAAPDNPSRSPLRRPVVGNAFAQDDTKSNPGPGAPSVFSSPNTDCIESSKTDAHGTGEKKTKRQDVPPKKGLGSAFK